MYLTCKDQRAIHTAHGNRMQLLIIRPNETFLASRQEAMRHGYRYGRLHIRKPYSAANVTGQDISRDNAQSARSPASPTCVPYRPSPCSALSTSTASTRSTAASEPPAAAAAAAAAPAAALSDPGAPSPVAPAPLCCCCCQSRKESSSGTRPYCKACTQTYPRLQVPRVLQSINFKLTSHRLANAADAPQRVPSASPAARGLTQPRGKYFQPIFRSVNVPHLQHQRVSLPVGGPQRSLEGLQPQHPGGGAQPHSAHQHLPWMGRGVVRVRCSAAECGVVKFTGVAAQSWDVQAALVQALCCTTHGPPVRQAVPPALPAPHRPPPGRTTGAAASARCPRPRAARAAAAAEAPPPAQGRALRGAALPPGSAPGIAARLRQGSRRELPSWRPPWGRSGQGQCLTGMSGRRAGRGSAAAAASAAARAG